MTTTVIRVAGTDITASVEFAETKFSSVGSGTAAPCVIKVRDTPEVLTFTPGARITVDIDGVRSWAGYLTSIQRPYAFDAENVLQIQGRFWLLLGQDINLLFQKRIVVDKAQPTNVKCNTYPAHTQDTTAIADLVSDFLYLTGDGIDTTTLVDNVATINEDQPANPFAGGWTWGQAMASITSLTGAIWGLTPERELFNADVETPNAPFGISTEPGAGEIGCRNPRILTDITSMANDVLAWGEGQLPIVFDREESSSSISAYQRWQRSYVTAAVYKQNTINRIATTALNGSPSSKRGLKDPRQVVTCMILTPGFRVGQKVNFSTDVFGYSITLPIRRMDISFPTPTDVEFALTLSNEYDPEWSFVDPFIVGDYPGGRLPKLPPLPPPVLPGTTDEPGECDCGITDTFTRTVSGSWGTSDSTISWVGGSTVDGHVGVDGSSGVWQVDPFGTGFGTFLYFPPLAPEFDVVVLGANFSSSSGSEPVIYDAQVIIGTPVSDIWLQLHGDGSRSLFVLDGLDNPEFSFDFLIPFNIRVNVVQGSETRFRFWHVGDPEPTTWDATSLAADTGFNGNQFFVAPSTELASPLTFSIDSLDITGINRCTENRFDNFNRTVSNGWGTSSDGHSWAKSGNASFGVDGTVGHMNVFAHSSPDGLAHVDGTGPWNSRFLMTALFTVRDNNDWLSPDFFIGVVATGHFNANVDLYKGGAGTMSVSGANSNGSAIPGLIDGVTYFLKWDFHRTDSHVRAKIWPVGSTEPDWQVDFDDGVVAFPPDRFYVSIHAGATEVDTSFDYIDFDYDGKPCYRDCTPSIENGTSGIFDSFTRTLSTTSWGTSDAGPIWAPGTGTHSVNGQGHLSSAAPTGFSTTSAQSTVPLPASGSASLFGPFVLSFDYTLGPSLNSSGGQQSSVGFGMTHDSSGNMPNIGFLMSGPNPDLLNDPGPNTYVSRATTIGGHYNFGVGPPYPWVPMNTNAGLGPDLSGTSGTCYVIASTDGLRIIAGGHDYGLVPWTNGSVPILITPGSIGFLMESMDFHCANGGSITVDNIRFKDYLGHYGTLCSPVIAPDVPGGPGGGGSTEIAVAITSTTYQVSSAYIANTTEVYVDSALQIRGVDYTESDPLAGYISFTTEPSGTVAVRYQVLAPRRV